MKKLILSLALPICITATKAENTSRYVDSLRSLLKSSQNDSNRVKILNEMSAYLLDMDSTDQAMRISNESLLLSNSLEFESGTASALRKSGLAYLKLGELSKSLDYLLKSLQINERLNNSYEIFMLHNNIGNVYYCQKNYGQALEHLLKSYSYKKDNVFNLWMIGITYMEMGNYSLSLMYLEKDLRICSIANNKNGMADAINAIGTVYERKGENEMALRNYFEALKLKMEVQDNVGIIDAYAGIGDIYFKQREYDRAIEYENKSLCLAKKIGFLVGVLENQKKLSEIYDAIGNKELAYEFYKNYSILKDSIYGDEEVKRTVRAEMNFDFDKQQAIESAVHNEELRHQRIQRNIFILGFAVFLIFSVFLFMGFRKTKRQKNIIEIQKKLVEGVHKEVTDNIQYAKRIQDAVLTPLDSIKDILPNSFVYNAPKDIVSGDFVFVEKLGDDIIVAVADCTNHGVSGSMMTILCNNLLSEAISGGINSPADILNYINISISKKFHQLDGNTKKQSDIVKDGMDLVLCKINLNSMRYEFAGAYNPLIIVRDGSLLELKADKLQIGQTKEKYKNNEGELRVGDTLYMSSDGYADQFSSDGKKFMKKKFKDLLISMCDKPIMDQGLILKNANLGWRGNSEQTDDILVMGIRI